MKKLQGLSQVKAEVIDPKMLRKVVGGLAMPGGQHPVYHTGFQGSNTDWYDDKGGFGTCPAGC